MDVMVTKEDVTKYTYIHISVSLCPFIDKKREYWFAIEDKSICSKVVRLHLQVEYITFIILSLLGEGHSYL